MSVIVVGVSLSLRFMDLDTYKEQIIAQVRAELKRDLRYHSGDFSLRYGPSFTFSDITIKEKDGSSDFVKADSLTIKIALLPLLRRQVVVSRIQLERPVLELSRDRNGVFNVSDLFNRPPGDANIGGIELKKARVTFTDLAVAQTPVVTQLSDTDVYLSRLTRGKNCDFKFSGSLVSGARKEPFFLAGVAKLPAAGAPWTASEITGRVRTGTLDAAHFWPYYSRYVPFRSMTGNFALEGAFKGTAAAFKSKVELSVGQLDLDYPQIFHARLTPRSVKASCQLDLQKDNLSIEDVKLVVDGLTVHGNCRLLNLRSKDPRIVARANTNSFNLRDYRQFIPYGIIVKDTADFIEQKIRGGIYRLEDGRLDGRVSQILHMELGQNYNILTCKAQVQEGVVAYGNGFPVCSAIKGELMLAGKDFILKGMTGNFGTSPMALEGRITDYPLVTPCRYLFSANVRPRQPEVAWVLGRGLGHGLLFADGGSLKVNGEGGTTLYNLWGEGDLGAVSYTVPDIISKPKGRPNKVSFRVSFGKDEYRITALNYQLAPLAVSATAVSRYDGPMSMEFRSNQFQAAEVAPLTPVFAKYHPAGRVQAQLHAAGPASDRLLWSGTVELAGVSLKAGEKVKPISGVTGSVKFNGDHYESPQLAMRIGSSAVSGRGSVNNLKAPNAAVTFYSPSLEPADLGLIQGKAQLRVERVQGTLAYSEEKDNLQISSLSGTIGRSQLQVKGVVQDLQHPKYDLSVNASHLEVEDLTPLFAGSSGGNNRQSMKIHFYAHDGRMREIAFQRLKGVLMLEDNILYLQPVECGSFDGEVTGRARIDFGSGAPRYQLNCNMQGVSADRMAHALGMKKQEVTGTLSLQGEISAKGNGSEELRRTALGAVKLKVERGSVKRFSTLSKIFSILNVSQLFKGQLPDMVSGGMPFNKITGDFAIRDGSATTHNLFMDSNAINLSAVGKLDLVRDELDMTIGVQPLQTVDKVVSHIPIVGWILTGKDHSLITTYFEAKGKIEDPKVTAVPVKSLAKGVLNIFKRVFELPKRLITDTGEVIIGN